MKKHMLFVSLCLFAVIFLTGCRAESYSFKEPIAEIESIEIVSADNSRSYTVKKIILETEKESFLKQFQEIKFYKYLGDPPEVHGDAIKFNYKSGNYEIICYFSAEYIKSDATQFRWKNCDENDFNELLDKFSDVDRDL